jgi:hypothetical protein
MPPPDPLLPGPLLQGGRIVESLHTSRVVAASRLCTDCGLKFGAPHLGAHGASGLVHVGRSVTTIDTWGMPSSCQHVA